MQRGLISLESNDYTHTHTHTHCQIQFHLMYCQLVLLISLQQMLKKLQILSQARLLHHELTFCVKKIQ